MATITPLVWPYPHHPHVAHHCHQHPHLVGQVRRAAHTLHQLVEARRDTIEKLLLGADYLDSVSHCHHRHKHRNHNCHRHWHHRRHIQGHFRCGCDVKWAKQLARARALLVVDSLLQVRGDKFKTLYHSVLYPVQYSWTVIFRPMIITWSSWWRWSLRRDHDFGNCRGRHSDSYSRHLLPTIIVSQDWNNHQYLYQHCNFTYQSHH